MTTKEFKHEGSESGYMQVVIVRNCLGHEVYRRNILNFD